MQDCSKGFLAPFQGAIASDAIRRSPLRCDPPATFFQPFSLNYLTSLKESNPWLPTFLSLVTIITLAAMKLLVYLGFLAFGILILLPTLDAIHSAAPKSVSKPPNTDGVSKTYGVYFTKVVVPSDAGIGLVRVVVTCGRVAAITEIPDDWYIRTLRPAFESGREWSDFQFASNAIEFGAGHGVTRLPNLISLDGVIKIKVEDESCFDIAADVGDDMGSDWKIRLRKAELQMREPEP